MGAGSMVGKGPHIMNLEAESRAQEPGQRSRSQGSAPGAGAALQEQRQRSRSRGSAPGAGAVSLFDTKHFK